MENVTRKKNANLVKIKVKKNKELMVEKCIVKALSEIGIPCIIHRLSKEERSINEIAYEEHKRVIGKSGIFYIW